MNTMVPALLVSAVVASAPAFARDASGGLLVSQAEELRNSPTAKDDTGASASEPALLDRAKKAVQDAERSIGDAATAAGRSAADYLSDNPDLNEQILDFGKRLGVPGFEKTPSAGAELTVTRDGVGRLRVTAYGVPAEQDVSLGWLEDDHFHTLQTLTADDNGRIDVTIDTPPAFTADQKVTFALRTLDQRLRLASDSIKLR